MWTYLNGKFIPKDEVRVSPFDRGFLFGDSVYEVIPSYNNKLFLFDEHLERLKNSLSITNIPIPDSLKDLHPLMVELLKKNQFSNQAIYLQITRGVDPLRSHVSANTTIPTLFMSSTELEINPYREGSNKQGLKVRLEEDIRWKRCDVKATTLLPNIMPFHRGDKSNVDEILFHDGKKINEGSKSNIFFVFNDLIVTPPKEQNILLGITRNYFLKRLLEEGFKVLEKEIQIDDLNKADEIWLTSSTKEIQPVRKVDNIVLPEKELKEYYWYKALKILEEDLKGNC
jgi:D-alanine transaminase